MAKDNVFLGATGNTPIPPRIKGLFYEHDEGYKTRGGREREEADRFDPLRIVIFMGSFPDFLQLYSFCTECQVLF